MRMTPSRCLLTATLAAALLGAPPPARPQTVATSEPAEPSPGAGVVLEHLEAPREIGLGTMVVRVWAHLRGVADGTPLGASLVFPDENGGVRQVALTPTGERLDSGAFELTAAIDTYAWVREGVHEYELHLSGVGAGDSAIARGSIRVKPRVTSPDLFLINRSGLAQTWLGTGAGGFTAVETLDTGLPRGRPRAVDLTGDGRPDLVVPEHTGDVRIYANQGGGRFAALRRIEGAAPIVDAACGDLDGDGATDLVVVTTAPELEIFPGAQPHAREVHSLRLHPEWVEVADLDNNGSPEIYVALLGLSAAELEVWARASDSQASFASIGLLSPLDGGERGRIAGLLALPAAADGKARLLVLSGDSGEASLESWGGGADIEPEWEPACRYTARFAGLPLGITAARCGKSGEVSCLLCVQLGAGSSLLEVTEGRPPRRLLALETAPAALVAADLDGDGDDDLVTAGKELRLWVNILGEGFREAGESPYRLESAAVALLAGDLDERGPQ